jgi:hypothetical protein
MKSYFLLINIFVISNLLSGCASTKDSLSGSIYKIPNIINTDYNFAVVWRKNKAAYKFWYNLKKGPKNGIWINPYTYNPGAARNTSLEEYKYNKPSTLRASELAATTNSDSGQYVVFSNSLYSIASSPKNNELVAKTARNQLQNAIIGVSKEAITDHFERLKSSEDSMNLFFSGATMSLAGAASVVSGGGRSCTCCCCGRNRRSKGGCQ